MNSYTADDALWGHEASEVAGEGGSGRDSAAGGAPWVAALSDLKHHLESRTMKKVSGARM